MQHTSNLHLSIATKDDLRVNPAQEHEPEGWPDVWNVSEGERDNHGGENHDDAVRRGCDRVENTQVRRRWLRRGPRTVLKCVCSSSQMGAPCTLQIDGLILHTAEIRTKRTLR